MARYCLETATAATAAMIHEQCCAAYNLASLLAEGRVSDIGTHASATEALDSQRTAVRGVVCCAHCCDDAVAAAPLDASVNAGGRVECYAGGSAARGTRTGAPEETRTQGFLLRTPGQTN